jgi:autotransporter-associated beta strand protein
VVDIEPIKNAVAGSFTMSTAALGSALDINGSAGGSLTFGNVALQSTLPIVANTNQTAFHIGVNTIISGVLSNQAGSTNGDILKDGPGTLTFSGSASNTYLGTTYVSGGTLMLAKTSGIAVPGDLTVFGGGTVQLAASNQIATTSHVTLDAALTAAVLDLNNFSNTIGQLSFAAGGTLTTEAGTATLGGNVDLTGTSGMGVIAGNLNLGGATRTFTVQQGSGAVDLSIAAVVSGTGGITMAGPGVLSLSGVNTFTGPVTINAGVLEVNADSALGNPANTVTLAGGSLDSSAVSNRTVTLGAGGGTVEVDSTNSSQISGSLSGNGGLTKTGTGSLTLEAANSYAGTTIVNGGTLIFGASGAFPNGNTLTINAGTAKVSNLVNGNKIVMQASSLTFGGSTGAWTGQLDLTSNDMVVHNGVVANIANQLKTGFNVGSGYWNGAGGIISTTAASDSTHLTTLGYRTGGSPLDGVNTTSSDVLVMYTYYGDADLNGTVNGADYQQIDMGFGLHLTGWSNGDFNYDGVVDGSDYSLIDNTFNQINATGASPLAIIADPSDLIASPADATAVPEPTNLGLLSISEVGLLRRRGRRKT